MNDKGVKGPQNQVTVTGALGHMYLSFYAPVKSAKQLERDASKIVQMTFQTGPGVGLLALNIAFPCGSDPSDIALPEKRPLPFKHTGVFAKVRSQLHRPRGYWKYISREPEIPGLRV